MQGPIEKPIENPLEKTHWTPIKNPMKNLTSKSHLCSSAYTTPPTQGQEGMPHETEPELFAPAAGRKKLDSIVVDVGCNMRISQSVECVYQYTVYIYIHIRTHAWHVLSIYYICMTCIIYLHIYSQEVLPGYAYMYILCNRKNNKGYDWCKCTYRSITWIRIEKEWGCNGYNKPQKDAKDCFQDVNKDETLTSHFQDSHCVLH